MAKKRKWQKSIDYEYDIKTIKNAALSLPPTHKEFILKSGKSVFVTINHEEIMLRIYRLSGKEAVNLYYNQVKRDCEKQKRRGKTT